MPYADKDKNKACVSKWSADNKERKAFLSRKSHLKRKYGLTIEQYEELSSLWDNKCAICKNPPNRQSLDVDHCHKLGHVRGVLCDICNKILGMANDNTAILKDAIVYLEAYNETIKELSCASNSLEK
jgi:hypothetical protein